MNEARRPDDRWPHGGGDMAERIRTHDWGSTPLGACDRWPAELRCVVELVLASPIVATAVVGQERVLIYNDAAAALYGDKHPAALGRPVASSWPDAWAETAYFYERVFAGESVHVPAQPLDLERAGAGQVFDAYLAPVRAADGTVIAAHMNGFEVGTKLRLDAAQREAEGRQAFLLDLSDRLRTQPDAHCTVMTSLDLLADHMRLDRAYVAQVDKARDRAEIGPEFLGPGLAPVEGSLTLSDFPEAFARVEANTLVLTDTASDPSLSELDRRSFNALGMDALIVASARKGTRNPVWALLVATTGPRQWTTAEVALVEEVAERTWAALGRVRAETKVSESEAKYRTLFETMGQGYCQLELVRDASGHAIDQRYIELNPAFERLIGIPVAQAKGRTASEVLPELESWWTEAFDRIVKHGEPGRIQHEVGSLHRSFEVLVYPQGGDVLTVLYDDITERKRAEDVLRESEERQGFLLRLSDSLRAEPNTHAVAERAIRMLFEQMQLDRCYITFYRPADDRADFPYQVGNDAVPALPATVRLSDFPDAYEQVLDRTVVIEDDFERRGLSETERRSSEGLGMRALLASTLRKGENNPLSSMVAASGSPRRWTRGEISLVEEAAERTWAAMERARVEQVLRESEERQAFLLQLSDALRPLANPEEIKRTAVHVLGRHLQASRVAYAENDEEDESFVVSANYVDGVPEVVGRRRYKDYGRNIVSELQAGRTCIQADIATDEHLRDAEKQALLQAEVGASLNVPLVKEGRLVAFLRVNYRAHHSFEAREIQLVTDVAERTWGAVERARVEIALRESQARLTTAFESVPVGLAVIDPEGKVTLMNADYRRFTPTGFIPTRDPGRIARWRAWDSDGQPINPDLFPGARALRGENVVPGLEMLYTDHDGREVWTSVASAPIHDSSGRVTGAVSVISDIDGAKRSAEALRESEALLRQFGEASQDILWVRDAETLQWSYLTPAFEAIYGLTRDQALSGDDYRNWVDLILPEDREYAVSMIDRVRAGEQVTFDYRITRPSDGVVRWMRDTDFPIYDANGAIRLVGGIGHDATELREAQAQLQALIEGVPQIIWRAVDGGKWTWASPQWTAFTGQAEADSHGLGWLDCLHADDRDAALAAWSLAMERGGFKLEYRLRERSGDYSWFSTRATPVRDKTGAIIEWLGTSTDIHGLRQLQERQGVLVGELQHRTRNLIGVVRSLANRTLDNASSLDDFGVRFEHRLAALSRVQGLLSHLTAGERVAFDELLRAELTALGALDGKAERVTLDGPAGVPLRSATVQTLALALHELATNAVKYGALATAAPDGHLTVRWSVETPAGSDRARLRAEWHESGVAMADVDAPARGGGYGRELIERALPYQLGAKTTYELGQDGIRCTIDVPIAARQGMAE